MRTIVHKKLFDHVRLIAQAKDEVLVTEIAIILHHMPKNRLIADRDHRFRDALRILTNPSAQAPAEQNDFHERISSEGLMTVTAGIGTTNLPPQRPMCFIC